MKRIKIYPLDNGPIKMIKGDEILAIQIIHDKPYITAISDNEEEEEDYKVFIILASGMPILENYNHKFIGSFQAKNDFWHVFELNK